ncbi:hypothetical protein SDC9_167420 [bioreactor metagenome]|uniref:Uncharacterized protein n=1 Tax=bioreactor metagenome TaxID=1076179 RepID=A0A645G7F5_9ZZZZ
MADRLRRADPFVHVSLEDMNVGSADAAVLDGNDRFAGTGLRSGNLPAFDAAGVDVLR